MFEVSVEETFAAGHALRQYKGKCENVHGHNYRIRVTMEGDRLNAIGLLVDFVELKKVMRKTIEYLDHKFINDVPPFDVQNPSAENIAKFFFEEISAGMKLEEAENEPRLAEVRVWETDTSIASYRL